MAKSLLLFFSLSFLTIVALGKKKVAISGTIKDASTGETLIGASVRIKELPQSGTSSNNFGFYSLSAPEGDYTLIYTYVGYETQAQQASFHKTQVLDIKLAAKGTLNEVVIT